MSRHLLRRPGSLPPRSLYVLLLVASYRTDGTSVRWPRVGRLARTHCRIVGHRGDWTFPDAQCVRVRVCKRCGDVTSEQVHTWSAFEYVAPDRCEQQRQCQRCGTVESHVLHEWGPWRYVGPDSFQLKLHQVHVCSRCGVEEQTEFERAF